MLFLPANNHGITVILLAKESPRFKLYPTYKKCPKNQQEIVLVFIWKISKSICFFPHIKSKIIKEEFQYGHERATAAVVF